MEKSEPI